MKYLSIALLFFLQILSFCQTKISVDATTYEESWELVPGKAYWLMAREPVVIRVRE